MKTKYNESFYDSSVVVSTTDIVYYYVTGYTKTDKAFEVMILHQDGTYGIVSAVCN